MSNATPTRGTFGYSRIHDKKDLGPSGTREVRSHRYYHPAATTRVLGATSVSFSYSTSIRGPPAHRTITQKSRRIIGEYARFGLRELNSALRFPRVGFDFGVGFDPVSACASPLSSSPESSLSSLPSTPPCRCGELQYQGV